MKSLPLPVKAPATVSSFLPCTSVLPLPLLSRDFLYTAQAGTVSSTCGMLRVSTACGSSSQGGLSGARLSHSACASACLFRCSSSPFLQRHSPLVSAISSLETHVYPGKQMMSSSFNSTARPTSFDDENDCSTIHANSYYTYAYFAALCAHPTISVSHASGVIAK
ncbi:hypothetical protein EDD85DRAFT_164933 [Armillaria nabsnona]|nr:hypothetical protein EDD85DRAFT_164933 [Armillaria nabsnona]